MTMNSLRTDSTATLAASIWGGLGHRVRVALAGTVALLLCPVMALADTLGVVELFSSQGCSSCPPADEVLGRLADDPRVVALTFAVDYWDYLGWKDSFARPEFSRRQRGYAEARGQGGVYTPQAVVNGREDVIGTDEHAIQERLRAMRQDGLGPSVEISARIVGDRVVVSVPAGSLGTAKTAALWIASYRTPQAVTIARGENTGRTVTYYNVVERWQVLGMWDGQPLTVELPLADVAQDSTGGLAVILQTKANGRPGPILGASRIDLKNS